MTAEDVAHLLRGSDVQRSIEQRLVKGVTSAWTAARMHEHSQFEHSEALGELLNLGSDRDCHYDRPTIGVHYALWYQARRINDAIRALIGPMTERAGDIQILDLGAGTGSTWIAADAIERARRHLGGADRQVTITAVDSSPIMLRTGTAIWSAFDQSSPVSVATRASGWAEAIPGLEDPLVVASYLLDHSDAQRTVHVANVLLRVLEHHRSREVVVISAPNKTSINHAVADAISGSGGVWQRRTAPTPQPIWSGPVRGLVEMRKQSVAAADPVVQSRLSKQPPSWGQAASSHIIHLVRSPYESLATGNAPTVALDPAQEAAAKPENRMTAILGVAGSGKSRVLIERLIRSLEADVRSRRGSSTLVTSFNKQLLSQLLSWFDEARVASPTLNSLSVHHSGRVNDQTVRLTLSNRSSIRIRFMNWDKVPTQLFGVRSDYLASENEEEIQKIIDRWLDDDPNGLRRQWADSTSWLTPQFVLTELRRVVFGLGAQTEAEYLKVARTGRGAHPRLSGFDRKMLWSLMVKDRKQRLFIDNRMAMSSAIASGAQPNARFDRLFIDEAQDFLPIEFTQVLPTLVRDPVGIVVAADGTQAMHVGASFNPPWTRRVRQSDGSGHRLWKVHELVGSYRLPVHVADAVRPLAQRIQAGQNARRSSPDAEVPIEAVISPTSVKNSVIGVRPIVISPSTLRQASESIGLLVERFHGLIKHDGQIDITWAESAKEEAEHLSRAMRVRLPSHTVNVLTESMRAIKGLERPVVLWQTINEGQVSPGVSMPELVYTALTRTTCLLVIWLNEDTPSKVKKVVASLNQDHLMFWDAQSRSRFMDWRA